MNRAEDLMSQVRVRLAQAAMCEARAARVPAEQRAAELDTADAYGAVAANKLAQVVRINSREAQA